MCEHFCFLCSIKFVIYNFFKVYIIVGFLKRLEGPGILLFRLSFHDDDDFITSIIALFCSIDVFTIIAISLSDIFNMKLDNHI